LVVDELNLLEAILDVLNNGGNLYLVFLVDCSITTVFDQGPGFFDLFGILSSMAPSASFQLLVVVVGFLRPLA
jgi:hypothetical protein